MRVLHLKIETAHSAKLYVYTLSELQKVRVDIFVDEISCTKNNVDIDKYIGQLTRKLI
jgi:predicted GNAT family N-acyltransferase